MGTILYTEKGREMPNKFVIPIAVESEEITKFRGYSQELSRRAESIRGTRSGRLNHGKLGDIMVVVGAILVTILIMGVALVGAQQNYPQWEPIVGTDEPEVFLTLQEKEVQIHSSKS
jgi:hypothetical protein